MEGQLEPGVKLLGKLRVVRLLGAGGLGAVYEVEHELTRHRRALKLLHPKYRENTEVVQRFLREASAAGHIGNPHIVETFDAGELPSGEPFLLMEMLAGQPLANVFRDQGRLPLGLAVNLVSQAAEAVDAAHRAGIIHRDLKPDNLFVIQREGQPFIKVLDFGISKFDSKQTGAVTVTTAGAAMGTPLYMAPEQMRGAHDVDARADVYALGIVLYEALVGGVPYYAESFAELAALVLGGRPPPLLERRPEVPAELAAIVHRAINVQPADRYPSATAFAQALAPFVGVEVGTREGQGSPSDTLMRPGNEVGLATPAPVSAARASMPLIDSTLRRTPGVAAAANADLPASSASSPLIDSTLPRTSGVSASSGPPAPQGNSATPVGLPPPAGPAPVPVERLSASPSSNLPRQLLVGALIAGVAALGVFGLGGRAGERGKDGAPGVPTITPPPVPFDAGAPVPTVTPPPIDAGAPIEPDAGVVAPVDAGTSSARPLVRAKVASDGGAAKTRKPVSGLGDLAEGLDDFTVTDGGTR